MARTKIVRIAGRYGARYGSTLRKKVRDILEKRYAPHKCPFCGVKGRIIRISVGIWKCRKCNTVFAGGAYTPKTELSRYLPSVIIKE